MFRKACLPDIRYKDTKNGKSLDRIYKKVSINTEIKKRASSSEPLVRVRKAQRLFFFYLHQILLPENQSFFLPLKNKLQLPIK